MKAKAQSPKSKDKPAKKKGMKSQSMFTPRKSSAKPAGGKSSGTTLPRTKPVLSGKNAGQA
jgi:hypothetical protein